MYTLPDFNITLGPGIEIVYSYPILYVESIYIVDTIHYATYLGQMAIFASRFVDSYLGKPKNLRKLDKVRIDEVWIRKQGFLN
jgi:hypothetical protein